MVSISTFLLVPFLVVSITFSLSSASTSATCPEDQSIIEPCTCISSSSSSLETAQSLPALSCINFLGNTSIIPLGNITQQLEKHFTSTGQSTELDRLLVVNAQLSGQLTADQLGALQYHYLSVYETNLTTVQANALTVRMFSLKINFQAKIFSDPKLENRKHFDLFADQK